MSLKNLEKYAKDVTVDFNTDMSTYDGNVVTYSENDVIATSNIVRFAWYNELRNLFQPTED